MKVDYLVEFKEKLQAFYVPCNGIVFITITFKEGLSVAETVAFFRAFLEKIKRELGIKGLTYFYSFELHEKKALHVHLLLNNSIGEKLKKKLLEFWNKKNGWVWYNARGLDFKVVADKPGKPLWESLDDLLNYMVKCLFPIKNYLELQYLFGKRLCFSCSLNLKESLKLLEKFINDSMDSYCGVTFSPLRQAVNISKEKFLTVRGLMLKFFNTEIISKDYTKLYNLLELVAASPQGNDMEMSELQQKVETFIYEENYGRALDIDRWFNIHDVHVRGIFEALVNKFNSLLDEKFLINNKNDFLETLRLVFTTERLVVILLESLVAYLRPLKKDILGAVDGNESSDEKDNGTTAVIVTHSFLMTRLIWSLKYNLHRLLIAKSKDGVSDDVKKTLSHFLFRENLSHCNKELITKLLHILDYEGKSFCGLVNTDTLIDPDNESESAFDDQIFIGLSFLIIEAAKGVGLLTAQSLNSVVKGKKYKTLTIFEINSTVLKHFINEVALLHIQLPFVVPPKDFVMVEKGVYRGGYSIKELSDKYNIFVNEKYVLKPFIEDGTLAYINKWQKQGYSIDENYLEYLMSLTLYEVFELTEGSIDLRTLWPGAGASKDRKKFDAEVLAKQFLMALYIADKYKGLNALWFLWKMDARLRVYAIGSPLNFQGPKLLRYLFQISKDFVPDIKLSQASLFFRYVLQRKENFYRKYLWTNPHYGWVQLDAKAQSFQIIGGLLGDRFLLQLVFVLEGSESLDIYAYYLGKLKEEITNGSLAISIKEALDVYEKSIVVSDYYRAPLHKALKILNYIDKQILTRDFVKRILMFTSYNKSLKETVEDELKRFFKPKYSNYKGLFPVMHLLVSKVLLFLKQDFPKIGKLKRLFTHLASIGVILNKGIFMSLNNSSALGEEPLLKRSFLQNYPKMTTFKVQRWVPLKKEKANDPSGKNVTVYFYDMVKDGNNVVLLDLKKNQNALLPNSMHHIDAEILFLTISKLLQKNIPILAIHDAYYTSFEHASEVKESYINSYRTIMKGKPLVAYIRNSFSYWCVNSMSFGNLLGVLCFEEDAKGYLVCAPLKLKIRKTLTKEQLQLLKHIKGVIGCYNSILEGKLSPEELDKELQDHGSSQILS